MTEPPPTALKLAGNIIARFDHQPMMGSTKTQWLVGYLRFNCRSSHHDEALSSARMLQLWLNVEPAIGRHDNFEDLMPAMRTGFQRIIGHQTFTRQSCQLVEKSLPTDLAAADTMHGRSEMAFNNGVLLVIDLGNAGTKPDCPFHCAVRTTPPMHGGVQVNHDPDGHLRGGLTLGDDQPPVPRGLCPMNTSQRIALPKRARSREIPAFSNPVLA
ncbi:MAG: hypothetical protein V4719_03195 [Planctomycetota bacterium]